MLVKICMNGSKLKEDLPTVPTTVADYEKEIPLLMEQGVRDFHIHFRGEDGVETLEQSVVEPQFRALKQKFPGCRIGIGSPLRSGRTAAIREKQIGEWTNWRPDYISLNICEEGSLVLSGILREKNVPIEWGIFTMKDAVDYVQNRCVDTTFRVLIEVSGGAGETQRADAEAIYRFLHEKYADLEYLLHGSGRGTWVVIRYAKAHALPYRIGLEDTAVDENGKPLPTNLALYRHAQAL